MQTNERTDGQTDRQTDVTMLTVAFNNFENAPNNGIARLKRDGTCAETRFGLSARRTSPFKSAEGGASVQSTAGSRRVRINGSNVSNAGYTVF